MRHHALFGGAKILVVEDEHLVALDIQKCLERMHYEPTVVYSGDTAVLAAHEVDVDLVLMDIKLGGGIDGIDAATKIRSDRNIPIIYLTAYTDPVTLERARATEPYGYVLKPFQERELMAAIEMALHRSEEERRRSEHQRLERFLFDASAKLVSSLDAQEVARAAARILVPDYADGCTIHLRGEEPQLRELTCAQPWDSANVPLEVKTLVAAAEESNRQQGQIAPHSTVCLPLVARGHVLGAIATTFNGRSARGDLPDQTFIEGFGHRLGLALDNALLYHSAQRALELRDDVLAVVSHDLRAPLATIMLHAELLHEHPVARRAADGIKQSAQLMNRLIGDLLDASAINAGHLALDLRPEAVGKVVGDAVAMFDELARSRDVTLVLDVSEPDVRVSCDRERVVQVLTNLIGNALQFTPPKGTVSVGAMVEGDRVRIDVEDSGAGIPEDQVPKMFDRFWRGEPRRDGAGLGLFIAHGIVAAHGGTIGVETAVGEGSRFSFSLPRAP